MKTDVFIFVAGMFFTGFVCGNLKSYFLVYFLC